MSPPTCPSPDLLKAYGLGTLSGEEVNTIALHLESCPACTDR